MTVPKVLIVEDQKYPLEAIQFAVNLVFPKHYQGFAKNGFDSAKFYERAEQLINGTLYDFVFLDHRMPRSDVGNLEEKDMHAFSDSLEGIGYGLISEIKAKNPNVVIVGTSSLSKEELRGMSAPDFTMSKMWGDAESDLEKILAQITGGRK